MNWKKILALSWQKVIFALVLQSVYNISCTYLIPSPATTIQQFYGQNIFVNLISGSIIYVAIFLASYLVSAIVVSLVSKKH